MTGPPPLQGIKVLEFAGLAPGPFAGMLLADAGASVLRVDRAVDGQTTHGGADAGSGSGSKPGNASEPAPTSDMLARHKSSIAVDLKDPRGVSLLRSLVASGAVDVLIDPFRPGVLERLGLGPDALLALCPRLVYARMSGFRRDGRYADMAGHDINYLAVSGALSLLGRAGERPHAPWNLLADFAGGGAALVQGVLLALVARASSGRGQVVEANMVDGSAYLATFPRMALKTPMGARGRGRNMLDGGCPFYDTYETRDGLYVAVGALEPQFFRLLVKGLGLESRGLEATRHDPDTWPAMRTLFEQTFRSKTRAEWERVFDGTDACCTPVLDYRELETAGPEREGDQRPMVTLRDTPCLAVKQGNGSSPAAPEAAAIGQGPGVPGEGYVPQQLCPGQGGEETLRQWMGWTRGADYGVSKGGLVLNKGAKESKL